MVGAGADDAEGDAPDGDADDEVAVAAERAPAHACVSQTQSRIATSRVSP